MSHRHYLVLATFAATTLGFAQAASAQAENYQPIREDTGLAGAYAASMGGGGFGATVEPKFNLLDKVSLGLRLEGVVTFGGSIGGADQDVSVGMGASAASLAKGEYFFTTGTARPWVGLGLGMYTLVSQSVDTGQDSVAVSQRAGKYFGMAPQLGVDLGRLRLAATYNVILGADVEVTQMVGSTEQTSSTSQNYFTFELGIRFGGARKAQRATLTP